VKFDEFLPSGKQVLFLRGFINLFSTILGTDINRRLGDLMMDCPCETIHDEPSIAGGVYRVVLLKRSIY